MGESSFWYRPTRVVPDQRPLNGRCCRRCIYCMSTQSTSGLVLPLTFSLSLIILLIVAMADDTDSFYAKTWSNWKEFRDDFEQYCKDTHQVFAILDLRTVEKQNTHLC